MGSEATGESPALVYVNRGAVLHLNGDGDGVDDGGGVLYGRGQCLRPGYVPFDPFHV